MDLATITCHTVTPLFKGLLKYSLLVVFEELHIDIYMYRKARNIGMKLYLVVGKIHCVSPNFILPTFTYACIKTVGAYRGAYSL